MKLFLQDWGKVRLNIFLIAHFQNLKRMVAEENPKYVIGFLYYEHIS